MRDIVGVYHSSFTLRVDDKHYEDIFAYGKDGG